MHAGSSHAVGLYAETLAARAESVDLLSTPLPSERLLHPFVWVWGRVLDSVGAVIAHRPALIYGLPCSPRYLSAVLPSVRADIVLPLVRTPIYLLSFVRHPTAPLFSAMTPPSPGGRGALPRTPPMRISRAGDLQLVRER